MEQPLGAALRESNSLSNEMGEQMGEEMQEGGSRLRRSPCTVSLQWTGPSSSLLSPEADPLQSNQEPGGLAEVSETHPPITGRCENGTESGLPSQVNLGAASVSQPPEGQVPRTRLCTIREPGVLEIVTIQEIGTVELLQEVGRRLTGMVGLVPGGMLRGVRRLLRREVEEEAAALHERRREVVETFQ